MENFTNKIVFLLIIFMDISLLLLLLFTFLELFGVCAYYICKFLIFNLYVLLLLLFIFGVSCLLDCFIKQKNLHN